MSWNKHLSRYAARHGGQFFGCNDSGTGAISLGSDGVAVLEYKGGLMMINIAHVNTGNFVRGYAVVSVQAQLERTYQLSLGAKKALVAGAHIVLRQMDKGIGAVAGEMNLIPDYGFPEVYGGRHISTSDQHFTKNILKDLDLRKALLSQPDSGVKVAQSGAEEGQHCVQARAPLVKGAFTGVDDWDLSWPDGFDQERAQARLHSNDFPQRLDALVHLAWAAQRAVLQWRMPSV